MSDFEDGRRVPDEGEREDAYNSKHRFVTCPQCGKALGKWYQAEPATLEYPGAPAELDQWEGSVYSERADMLFCSAHCLTTYTEE